MHLVTYRPSIVESARLGVVQMDEIVDVQHFAKSCGFELPSCMLAFIDLGPSALRLLKQLIASANGQWQPGCSVPAVNVQLLAPIPRPRKNIFGIGLNYVEHVAESSRTLDTSKDLPKQPVIFSKPPTTVIGGLEKMT